MSVNLGIYVYAPGQVVETLPGGLPQNHNGYLNINNPDVWDDDALRGIDLWPYTLIDAGGPAPPDAYTRSLGPYVFGSLECTQTAAYSQKDIDAVRIIRNSQLENNRIFPSSWDMIVDPLTENEVQDMEQWIGVNQAELAGETDWDTVANFPTTAPIILELGNQYVASSYQIQGAGLTLSNQAAIGSGQPAPYDQAAIDAFVSANNAAAGDSSGATSAVDPSYELRQVVAKVSESKSVLWVFREEDTQNKYLQARLTGKKDDRPLYCFIYLLSGTYLGWMEFLERPEDTELWVARSHSSLEGWIPSDLKLRFSYSTHPDIQADWITNDVPFEAGSPPVKTYIRWDKL